MSPASSPDLDYIWFMEGTPPLESSDDNQTDKEPSEDEEEDDDDDEEEWSNEEENNDDSNDDSNDKKTALILGTSADYAPFEFMYPDDKGELTYAGIDVSVAQYIADDMGLSLQVENMAFEYLLTSLGKGDFDMVLAAMEAPRRISS